MKADDAGADICCGDLLKTVKQDVRSRNRSLLRWMRAQAIVVDVLSPSDSFFVTSEPAEA